MTFDTDDMHCDSLSGSTVATHALSAPPSLRPARPRRVFKVAAGLAGGVALSAALASYLQGTPETAVPPALRVEGQTVSYSAGFAVRAGIRTMEVREAAFSPVISVSGTTSFDPQQVARVGASALGLVRRVAKYEGDGVKRGDVLAEIGSPLQARREAATSLRAGELPIGTLGVSVLRSPLDGVVVERRIVTGQSVRGERVVFVVANLDHLAVELSLDERQARALKVGDRVELSRDAQPSAVAAGRVVEVLALSASAEPRATVRVGVDNRSRGLRPGQAVTARIFSSNGARALVIPRRAVAWIAGQPVVFLSDGHNSASAAAVVLGGCDGEQTEVRLGLASGQRIVSDGVPKLKEASFL